MSRKLNKQLQDLEQKTKNELFIKEQNQKAKPASQRLAEKSQMSNLDEMLLVKEQRDTIEDFDTDLIELDATEEPLNIPNEMATKQAFIDNELAPVIRAITDIRDEPDFATRRVSMDNLIAVGNLIPNTLTADVMGNVIYNDMKGQIDSKIQEDFNSYMIKKPTSNQGIVKNSIEARVNRLSVPIIYNENMKAIMNYRNAWLQNESNKFNQQNNQKLRKYVNRIENQNLHSNVINVNRSAGESDESYAERLESFRNIPDFVNQQKLQLFQREKSKLRQNLLKITNEVNTQQIINLPEITDVNISNINKSFPRFESEIKRNFKSLKIDEFEDYFKDYISKVENQPMKFETLDMALGDTLNKAGQSINDKLNDIQTELSTINKKPKNTKKPSTANEYLQNIQQDIQQYSTTPWELNDVKKDSSYFLKTFGNDFDKKTEYKKKLNETLKSETARQEGINLIGNDNYDDLVNYTINKKGQRKQLNILLEKLNPLVLEYRNSVMNSGSSRDEAKALSQRIFGYGIARTGSEFVDFGKLILDINKLTDQNKLRVLYPNHINIKEIKTTAISQNFENIIVQLLESNKFNRSLFDALDKQEQDLLILLLNKAGLHKFLKDVKSKRDVDIDTLKTKSDSEYIVNKLPKSTLDRWNILKGMIGAGNDNKQLVKEAINICNTFKLTGHYSKSDCDEQIEYLKSLL